MPGRNLRVRTLLLGVALVAVVLGLLIVPAARLTEYPRTYRQVQALLEPLRASRPRGLTPAQWTCALDGIQTAVANIAFSDAHVPLEELRRVREDLARRLERDAGSADLDTLLWLWLRLARASPHGERYTRRNWYLLRDCVPADTLPPERPGLEEER